MASSKAAGRVIEETGISAYRTGIADIAYVQCRFDSGHPLRQTLVFPAYPAQIGKNPELRFRVTGQTRFFLELASGLVFVARVAEGNSMLASEASPAFPFLAAGEEAILDEADLSALGAALQHCSGSLWVAGCDDPLLLRKMGGRRLCHPHSVFRESDASLADRPLLLEHAGLSGELSMLFPANASAWPVVRGGAEAEQGETRQPPGTRPRDVPEHGARMFRNGLDQEALSLCAELGRLDYSLYNYLVGDEPLQRSRRLDAIRVAPFFERGICDRSEADFHAARAAVDGGTPLIDALAAGLRVSRESVRFLARLRPADFGVPEWSAVEELAENFDPLCSRSFVVAVQAVPPERRPRTPEGWRAFVALGGALQWLDDPGHDCVSRMLRRISKSGWSASVDKIISDYGSLDALRDARDYVMALADTVERGLQARLPADRLIDLMDETVIEADVQRVIADGGLWRLLDSSERWHREFDCEMSKRIAAMEKAGDHADLDFPLWDGTRVGDLTVVPLLSAAALIEEGNRMKHCVGSRYADCRLNGVRLFSIRSALGRSLSTFELGFAKKSDGPLGPVTITMNQHRGPRNQVPSPACAAAAKVFVHLIEDNAIDWDLQRVVAHAEETRMGGEDFDDADSGYEELVKEAKVAAVKVMMGKKMMASLTDETAAILKQTRAIQ